MWADGQPARQRRHGLQRQAGPCPRGKPGGMTPVEPNDADNALLEERRQRLRCRPLGKALRQQKCAKEWNDTVGKDRRRLRRPRSRATRHRTNQTQHPTGSLPLRPGSLRPTNRKLSLETWQRLLAFSCHANSGYTQLRARSSTPFTPFSKNCLAMLFGWAVADCCCARSW